MRRTRQDLQRDFDALTAEYHECAELLARLRAERQARAELIRALRELAAIPLPRQDQWEAYQRIARTRLHEIAKGLSVLDIFADPRALAEVRDRTRRLTGAGLGYDPDPAALPKVVADYGLSVVTEGGRPTPAGEHPYPPFIA